MQTVLISGSAGQLCSDIIEEMEKHKDLIHVIPKNKYELNVTNKDMLYNMMKEYRPQVYIHGASIHNVEEINKNPELACSVNIISLKNAAEICDELGCVLINFSTDYVLNGDSWIPGTITSEGLTEGAYPDPLNFYGITKLAGELTIKNICDRHFNIRVASLYGKKGSSAKNWTNFPYVMINKYNGKDVTKVVNDQWMTSAYTKDVAEVLTDMLLKHTHDYGTWHLVNRGIATWYKFAKEIYELLGYDTSLLQAVSSKEFYSNVKRSNFTALDTFKLKKHSELKQMPNWKNAIKRFLVEIGKI